MKHNSISKYKFYLLMIILDVSLIPQTGFSWGGSHRYPIDRVLVREILLTENYVFCGTNIFGLFVFDRRTETWSNYCEGNGFLRDGIIKIEKKGQDVYVTLIDGIVRFDLTNGRHEVKKESYKYSTPSYSLKIGNKTYTVVADSIISSVGDKKKVYHPPVLPPLYAQIPEEYRYGYFFSHPIIYENKIYFAYNFRGEYDSSTRGVGSFDINNNSFNFYGSEIFKRGDVTDCFIHNSSIIFSTASFVYEGDTRRAVGFVEFSPADSSFKIWNELSFPGDSLAIFDLEQDSLECWIGTDRGVFRIDRKTNNCIQYGIRKGVIPRNGINVYSHYGRHRVNYAKNLINPYPVVDELNKCDTVEILRTFMGWCEIKAPVKITGFVWSADVEKVIEPPGGKGYKKIVLKTVRTNKDKIKIKHRSKHEAADLIVLDVWDKPREDEYTIFGESVSLSDTVGGKKPTGWYRTIIPTAWIHIGDLTFCLEEIE